MPVLNAMFNHNDCHACACRVQICIVIHVICSIFVNIHVNMSDNSKINLRMQVYFIPWLSYFFVLILNFRPWPRLNFCGQKGYGRRLEIWHVIGARPVRVAHDLRT